MQTIDLRDENRKETKFRFIFGTNGEAIVYDSKLGDIIVEDIDGSEIVVPECDLSLLQKALQKIQTIREGGNGECSY